MRVLILNQYFPPDPAPTGVLFGEIAEALRAQGHEVECVDAGQEYRAGQGKGMRLLREIVALMRMLFRGVFRKKRVHVVVSGSSPPCLAVVAGLIAFRHWAPHLHWCMDLYPEIAVALRELSRGKLASIIGWFMGIAYRQAYLVVGLDSDMANHLNAYRVNALECRPWVPAPMLDALPSSPDAAPAPVKRWQWLYSGNLGRAHDWQTLLAAQAELEERGVEATLVFQGGGPSIEAARKRAGELHLKRVEWRPYAPEVELCASLLRAHCLVVTELPEVKGLLWPSKLALILGLPRLILFIGPKDGAIATLLRKEPHAGVFAPGDFAAVAHWIDAQRSAPDVLSQACVTDVRAHRERSLAWWCQNIERAARRS
jgi:colanic acid biosynthesis glycosyl transferase WcaI